MQGRTSTATIDQIDRVEVGNVSQALSTQSQKFKFYRTRQSALGPILRPTLYLWYPLSYFKKIFKKYFRPFLLIIPEA